MIVIYIFLSLIVMILMMTYILKYRQMARIKRLLSPREKSGYITIEGIRYKRILLYVSKQETLSMNSPKVIELKHKTSRLLFYDLHKHYVFITYPSQQKMLYVINENEVRFFDHLERVHGSYVVPETKILEFLRSKPID